MAGDAPPAPPPSDFNKMVQKWQEMQLRILVVASLLIQCFLFVSATLRKRRIPALLRFFIWLAYLSSDAVAIYALTTFTVRQEEEAGTQILWVPILLVHLGGQEAITAYNIQDNELWRRHVLTAVFKVTVAINVFVKYYRRTSTATLGHKKDIFVPGVLLFLCGITKCVCKPWDLKRVSINSLVDESSGPAQKCGIDSVHEYLRAAVHYVHQADRGSLQPSDGGDDDACKLLEEVWKPYNLCLDVAPPYPGRLRCLKQLVRNQDEAHCLVQSRLSATFDRLYTKESLKLHDISSLNLTTNVASNRWKILTSAVGIRTVAAAILLWAMALFPKSTGGDDVPVTYALLWCALVMEFVVPVVLDSFDKIKRWRLNANRWPDQVAQYNLMGYLARNRKHSWLMKMATCLVGPDLLDQRWCMKSSKSSHEITKLVHGHVAGGWTEGRIADAEAFRAFNDCRGQWTLDKDEAHTAASKHLRSSVSRAFDESIVLWHIATDFCFHLHHTARTPSCEAARRSREMSNYMAYLLFVNPEMLMPGARRSLFRAAYDELAAMLKKNPGRTPRDQAGLAHKAIELVKRDAEGTSVVHQAWSIAEDLMVLHKDDEDGMWVVIQGVWVEMLCFSAGRCRGYLHAKSLGTGGEYISYVWLLLLYMGMETLSEKMQRTELYEDCAEAGRTSAAAMATNDQNV